MTEPDFICPKINNILNKIISKIGKVVSEEFKNEIEKDLLDVRTDISQLREWGQYNLTNNLKNFKEDKMTHSELFNDEENQNKDKVNFTPLNGRILILAPVVKETTEAGIIKPEGMIKEEESSLDKYLEVIAVAKDVEDIYIEDKVMIVPGNHQVIEVDGINYLIVHHTSLMGKRL